jgi:hypothetical protein
LNKDASHYNDINFQGYFQSIFSYAYSISKSVSLLEDVEYDYVIFLRYDCRIDEPISLPTLNKNLFYTDKIGQDHSPLFYGDCLAVSNDKNIKVFVKFFDFLTNNIFDNEVFKQWTEHIKENKKLFNPDGRYEHGIFSNQVIYAYFLTTMGINYLNIVPKYSCQVIKNIV